MFLGLSKEILQVFVGQWAAKLPIVLVLIPGFMHAVRDGPSGIIFFRSSILMAFNFVAH